VSDNLSNLIRLDSLGIPRSPFAFTLFRLDSVYQPQNGFTGKPPSHGSAEKVLLGTDPDGRPGTIRPHQRSNRGLQPAVGRMLLLSLKRIPPSPISGWRHERLLAHPHSETTTIPSTLFPSFDILVLTFPFLAIRPGTLRLDEQSRPQTASGRAYCGVISKDGRFFPIDGKPWRHSRVRNRGQMTTSLNRAKTSPRKHQRSIPGRGANGYKYMVIK
jgi:hypothetical protein